MDTAQMLNQDADSKFRTQGPPSPEIHEALTPGTIIPETARGWHSCTYGPHVSCSPLYLARQAIFLADQQQSDKFQVTGLLFLSPPLCRMGVKPSSR